MDLIVNLMMDIMVHLIGGPDGRLGGGLNDALKWCTCDDVNLMVEWIADWMDLMVDLMEHLMVHLQVKLEHLMVHLMMRLMV